MRLSIGILALFCIYFVKDAVADACPKGYIYTNVAYGPHKDWKCAIIGRKCAVHDEQKLDKCPCYTTCVRGYCVILDGENDEPRFDCLEPFSRKDHIYNFQAGAIEEFIDDTKAPSQTTHQA